MKKNILPIKQRRLLYQKALDEMLNDYYKHNFYWYGLCWYLSRAAKKLNISFNPYSPYFGLNALSEIMYFEPAYKHIPDSTWFPYDKQGKKNRIKILRDAIKLAEPKPRLKITVRRKLM